MAGIPGPGPVNCQIRRKDDGTARCETHGVDFVAPAGSEEPVRAELLRLAIRAHIEEANLNWQAERDFMERAIQGPGGMGAVIGPVGTFIEIVMNALSDMERRQRERDDVQERIAKALERIAAALEWRVQQEGEQRGDLGK